jgi:hypothetical protein
MGVPSSPVRTLPIQTIVTASTCKGPFEELTAQVRALHRPLHAQPLMSAMVPGDKGEHDVKADGRRRRVRASSPDNAGSCAERLWFPNAFRKYGAQDARRDGAGRVSIGWPYQGAEFSRFARVPQ